MKEVIEQLKKLAEQNRQVKERTPWLDVALGGLQAAIENLQEHEKAVTKAQKK
jgi:hypothetical protein